VTVVVAPAVTARPVQVIVVAVTVHGVPEEVAEGAVTPAGREPVGMATVRPVRASADAMVTTAVPGSPGVSDAVLALTVRAWARVRRTVIPGSG
jgi:hypothetical protein